MVDALRRAHRWLRPTGYVIDIRPTAEAAHLEVQLAGRVVEAGRVGDVNQQVGPSARHATADTALANALDRRWFVADLRLEFSFFRHAATVDEVRDHVCSSWRGAYLDQESLRRAATLQATDPDARLWLREQIGLARLRPLTLNPGTAADG